MTWIQVITFIQDILVIVALVGVIWSAVVFVLDLRLRSERERVSRKSKWLQVSVHKIVHSSSHFLSVGEILAQLKSSSFDEDFTVEKHELSERELRVVLLEGLSNGYLDQLHGDIYGIARRNPIVESAMNDLDRESILDDAFDFISLAKSGISSAELIQRLNRPKLRLSTFERMLAELTHKHLIEKTPQDTWMPKRDGK